MYILGFDIGGTKCAVLLGRCSDGNIEIIKKVAFSTPAVDEALEKIFSLVAELTAEHSCRAIGISCGGPLDEERGLILSPPNLPGWDKIDICRMLTERFGIPAYLRNDANACALAEWKFGAGVGTKNMVFFTFGTGLGAGIIIDGRLYSGTNGMAGEAGHIRLAKSGPVGYGKAGSFEGFCSGGGIAKLAKAKAESALRRGRPFAFAKNEEQIASITTKTVAEFAKNGDKDALGIFRTVGKRLGEGLSVIIDILNPEAIVIGSIYARCENLLYGAAMSVIKKEALAESVSVCELLPAKLGESIGDVAALTVAIDGYEASSINKGDI